MRRALVVACVLLATAPPAEAHASSVTLRIVASTSTTALGEANHVLLGVEVPPSVSLLNVRNVMCALPPETGATCADGVGMVRVDATWHAFDAFRVSVASSTGLAPARVVVAFVEHDGSVVHGRHHGPGSVVTGVVPGGNLDLVVFLDATGATAAVVEVTTGAPAF